MTTAAQRKAMVAANRAARERLVATVLYLDERGMKGSEISVEVGRSNMAISRILTANGRRKKTMGVRRPINRGTKSVECSKCGYSYLVRKDRNPPFYCPGCRPTIKSGNRPHNAGQDTRVERKCIVCGATFKYRLSQLKNGGPMKGKFCSKPCWGVYQATPGSRYSEFGKGYRQGRRR